MIDMHDDKELLKVLLESLNIISKVTYGYVAVTDNNGIRIKTVDYSGQELKNLVGVKYDLACECSKGNKPVYGLSQLEEGAEAWCIPLGNYVLCASNYERIKTNNTLHDSLLEALPLIAKVVGGEAVMFDKHGKRTKSVSSDGKESTDYLGKISKDALRAMEMKRPVIGDSNYVFGASAVRIPITNDFGIGFNNDDSIRKSQSLLNEIKKNRNVKFDFEDIIGETHQVNKIKEIAKLASKSNSSVLIIGESGTGKELYAQAIHNASERRDKPFVAINCAAIPSNLLESSFFGYEKGSFTGALKEGQSGFFEQANGGTLFLDEISEMKFDLQSKLLRVLQEREVKRIGSDKSIPLDIRIISATNKDLSKLISENEFRLDLYYRLNVIDINLPPLRLIKEDIPILANYYIKKMSRSFGKLIEGIDEEAIEILSNYTWPGNVRELVNVIEKAFIINSDSNFITKDHLPERIRNELKEIESNELRNKSLGLALQDYEKKIIEKTLQNCNNSRVKASEKLGISTTTLWRRMKELGIS
jgi:transcriptional regulator with PAS, ATPase and Fis domain